MQDNDKYTWRVSYHDGPQLEERDAPAGFASVDQTRVKRLRLVSHSGIPEHIVTIPDGATPVFFRRRSIALNLAEENSEPRGTVHCIGWKRDEEAVYLFVFEDGKTLLSNDLQAV